MIKLAGTDPMWPDSIFMQGHYACSISGVGQGARETSYIALKYNHLLWSSLTMQRGTGCT